MSLVPAKQLFDIDRFFDDFWAPVSRETSPVNDFFAPRVDIVERDDHYEITAELPGINKDDIHVTLENGVLTIEAETSQEAKEEKDGKVIRQERRYGKYLRRFNLSDNVHEEDIKATFDDGILKLTAPKAAEEKPQQKRIEIK